MGTQFTKDMNIITNFLKDMDIIAALDDQPNDVGGLTAAELKAKFDEGGKAIQEYINGTLIPEVLGLDATEDAREQAEAERVAEELRRKQNESLRCDMELQRDAAEAERDLMESHRQDQEQARQEAEAVRQSQEGSRQSAESGRVHEEAARVSAEKSRASAESTRKSAETGRDASEVLRRDGEQQRQTAESSRASAEEKRVTAEQGRASAEAARASAESARVTAEQARVSAEEARTDSTNGIVAQATQQAQAASASAAAAKASETAALSGKDAAASSASAASASAQAAKASETQAAASAESVTTMSRAAESWAVGGTGTRPGEDTDNAKYWAGVAEGAAGGGVTTFNGRSGVVVPQTGDYTAAMVGALPAQTGTKGQLLGFTANNVVGAVEAPQSGGKRTARFTVGTSTAGWTAADCDYLCDGVDDQVEILAAVNKLRATGGEVVLLDGTYEIAASMECYTANVTIRGNGNGTVLRRNFDSTSANKAVISCNKSGCKVSHLKIDGNKASYGSTSNCGIALVGGEGHQVDHVTVVDHGDSGVVLIGSSCNTITGCYFSGNGSAGVKMNPGMGNVVEYNCISNNVILDGYAGVNLYIGSHNIIANNCFQRQESYAIDVQYSAENDLSVLGNDILYSGGFYAISAGSKTCLLCSGNRIRVTGDGSGIRLGSNSLVTGNMVLGSTIRSVEMYSKNLVTGNYLLGGTVEETGEGNVVADNITA